MPYDASRELLWEQVLQFLEEERVVVLVGPELSRLELDGRSVSLERVLAERLAEKLAVPTEGLDGNPLHEVSCRFLQREGDVQPVYTALYSVLRASDDLPVPRALLELAEITHLLLFVTTAVDPFLARALDQVRFGGEARTETLSFSLTDCQDLPNGPAGHEAPFVYHLFGRISALPSYAITEEDTLEFVHTLQSRAHTPSNLMDELTNKNLLVLGTGLPDWLSRFLIRLARRERLSESQRGKLDVLADASLVRYPELVSFLEHFSGRTKVYDGTALEFVDELHRRWTKRFPAAPAVDGEPAPRMRSAVPATAERGAIFLSYASEDRDVVTELARQLEAAGLDVWFDRDDLQGGDPFSDVIKARIRSCSLFVPILSRHVLTLEPRYFRQEWNHAVEVAGLIPSTRHYLFPVAIDDIETTADEVPEPFRRIHWERLEGGRAPERMIDALVRHFRDFQRYLGAAA